MDEEAPSESIAQEENKLADEIIASGEHEDGVELDSEISKGERNLDKLCAGARRRLRNDKDVVTTITGDEGLGKSVLEIKLCKKIDPKFRLDRNVLFNPSLEALHKLMYDLPPESAIGIDELIRIGYTRNWQMKANKLLNELYALCRFQRKASFFCIPRFNMVDSDLRRRSLFWIHVIDRGLAVVCRKDKNQFTSDPWHLKANEKILNDYFKNKPIHLFKDEDYLKAIKRSPNYVGFLTFKDFTPEEKVEYTALKKPFELTQVSSDAESKDTKRWRLIATNFLVHLRMQGMSQINIGKIGGIDDKAMDRILTPLDLTAMQVKNKQREENLRKKLDLNVKFVELPTKVEPVKQNAELV
jgi:hypothetical protein